MVEAKPAEAKAVEAKPVEAKSVQTRAAEMKAGKAKSVEPKLAELPAVSRPRSSHRKTRAMSTEQHAGGSSAGARERSVHASPAKSKRQRLSANTTTAEDLKYEGYTSSDSFSNDRVMTVDWRVYQVKHRDRTSNMRVTQYWHWVDEEALFEHQVLEDVLDRRVKWGVYKDPIDFHLRLRELTEITYAPNTLNVIIGTQQIRGVTYRGDIMAQFKRERTKKRFLEFLQKKGIKLVKTTP